MASIRDHSTGPVVLLAGLTLLGFGLRLFQLGSQSYWLDEAISLGIAQSNLTAILSNVAQSSHPPLYYLALKGWLALGLGENETTVRLLSALLSTAAIPVVYVLAHVLANRKAGLIGAALMAIMPFQVLYAQEARMYGLLAFLTSLTLLAFVRAWRTNRWHDWLLFTVAMISCLYTHYFSFLLLAGLGLFSLLESLASQKHDRWLGLLLSGAALILLFSPQMPLFLNKATNAMGTRWIEPNYLFFFTSLYFLLMSYTLSKWAIAVAAAMFIVFFIVLLVLWRELKTAWRLRDAQTQSGKKARQATLFALSTTITPLLIPAILLVIKPFWIPERTLTIVMPAYTLLLALGLTRVTPRSPLPALYGLLAVLMLVSLGNYYFDPAYAKPPYRQAAELVAEYSRPGDIEVHTSDGSYLPFLQYSRRVVTYLLRGDPDARKPDHVYYALGGQVLGPETVLAHEGRIWLVIALEHSIDYQLDTLTWFQEQRSVLDMHDIRGIRIYLLGRIGQERKGPLSPFRMPMLAPDGQSCRTDGRAIRPEQGSSPQQVGSRWTGPGLGGPDARPLAAVAGGAGRAVGTVGRSCGAWVAASGDVWAEEPVMSPDIVQALPFTHLVVEADSLLKNGPYNNTIMYQRFPELMARTELIQTYRLRGYLVYVYVVSQDKH